MTRYVVYQAILVRRNSASSWRVTFRPEGGADGDEIVVMVSPLRMEQMSFSAPYTMIEIEGFRERDDA